MGVALWRNGPKIGVFEQMLELFAKKGTKSLGREGEWGGGGGWGGGGCHSPCPHPLGSMFETKT